MRGWTVVLLVLVVVALCGAADAAEVSVTSDPPTVARGQIYTVTSTVELEPWRMIAWVTTLTADNIEPVVASVEIKVGEPLRNAVLSTSIPAETEFVSAEARDAAGVVVTVSPDVGGVVTHLFGDVEPGQVIALAIVLAAL